MWIRFGLVACAAGVVWAEAPAEACSLPPPEVSTVLPEEGSVLPANGQLYVMHSVLSGAVRLRLYGMDGSREPLASLNLEDLVPGLGFFRLPDPQVLSGVQRWELTWDGLSDDESRALNYSVDLSSRDDVAPSPVDPIYSVERFPLDSCGFGGVYLRAVPAESSQDAEGPLLGYALLEHESGEVLVRDVVPVLPQAMGQSGLRFRLMPWDGQEQPDPSPFLGRCFSVVAVDQAGNRSDSSGRITCIDRVSDFGADGRAQVTMRQPGDLAFSEGGCTHSAAGTGAPHLGLGLLAGCWAVVACRRGRRTLH